MEIAYVPPNFSELSPGSTDDHPLIPDIEDGVRGVWLNCPRAVVITLGRGTATRPVIPVCCAHSLPDTQLPDGGPMRFEVTRQDGKRWIGEMRPSHDTEDQVLPDDPPDPLPPGVVLGVQILEDRFVADLIRWVDLPLKSGEYSVRFLAGDTPSEPRPMSVTIESS